VPQDSNLCVYALNNVTGTDYAPEKEPEWWDRRRASAEAHIAMFAGITVWVEPMVP
jgi:hypothetical protein